MTVKFIKSKEEILEWENVVMATGFIITKEGALSYMHKCKDINHENMAEVIAPIVVFYKDFEIIFDRYKDMLKKDLSKLDLLVKLYTEAKEREEY